MRIVLCAAIAATGVVGLVGSALAADMTGAEIKAFLSGKTVYLETTAASASAAVGQGVIYWGEDGTALYKTATGAIMHGKWEVKGNTNCTDWKERPNTACVRYDKTGDASSPGGAGVFQSKKLVEKGSMTDTGESMLSTALLPSGAAPAQP